MKGEVGVNSQMRWAQGIFCHHGLNFNDVSLPKPQLQKIFSPQGSHQHKKRRRDKRLHIRNTLLLLVKMVPVVRLELTRARGPGDFETTALSFLTSSNSLSC